MSVTEELRKELARRGIGYETDEKSACVTRVRADGRLFVFYELGERLTTMTLIPDLSGDDVNALTVEQAIDATVGGFACNRVYHPNRTRASGPQYTCSECGYGASDDRWEYCPKCGRKYLTSKGGAIWE